LGRSASWHSRVLPNGTTPQGARESGPSPPDHRPHGPHGSRPSGPRRAGGGPAPTAVRADCMPRASTLRPVGVAARAAAAAFVTMACRKCESSVAASRAAASCPPAAQTAFRVPTTHSTGPGGARASHSDVLAPRGWPRQPRERPVLPGWPAPRVPSGRSPVTAGAIRPSPAAPARSGQRRLPQRRPARGSAGSRSGGPLGGASARAAPAPAAPASPEGGARSGAVPVPVAAVRLGRRERADRTRPQRGGPCAGASATRGRAANDANAPHLPATRGQPASPRDERRRRSPHPASPLRSGRSRARRGARRRGSRCGP